MAKLVCMHSLGVYFYLMGSLVFYFSMLKQSRNTDENYGALVLVVMIAFAYQVSPHRA